MMPHFGLGMFVPVANEKQCWRGVESLNSRVMLPLFVNPRPGGNGRARSVGNEP
jgi:hypothetical protein